MQKDKRTLLGKNIITFKKISTRQRVPILLTHDIKLELDPKYWDPDFCPGTINLLPNHPLVVSAPLAGEAINLKFLGRRNHWWHRKTMLAKM